MLCCGGIGLVALLGDDATPAATAPVPEPDEATWKTYIADLVAIDPDIVHGKEEKAVDRGRDQCSSISGGDLTRAKLVDLTRQRFTSPSHPEGFGPEVAARILDVVHARLCPALPMPAA